MPTEPASKNSKLSWMGREHLDWNYNYWSLMKILNGLLCNHTQPTGISHIFANLFRPLV